MQIEATEAVPFALDYILHQLRISPGHVQAIHLSMDFQPVPAKREKRRFFAWHSTFGRRRRRAYPAEDRKLTPEAHQTIIDAFFAELTSRLDPPQYSYTSLRQYLEQADERELRSAISADAQGLVLLDDRRDTTGWLGTDGEAYSARDWDGYSRYPPEGENPTVLLLNTQDLYKRQSESVGSCPLYKRNHL